MKNRLAALAVGLCLVAATSLQAAFVAITVPPPGPCPAPGSAYGTEIAAWRAASTLIPITAPVGSAQTSLSGTLAGAPFTISYLTTAGGVPAPHDTFSVPGSWATWSAPPCSETATPVVQYSRGGGATTRHYQFSTPVQGFSFEIEPNPFAIHSYTATLVGGGMVTGSIDGSAGARVIGGQVMPGDPLITGVTIAGSADYAFGGVRALAPAGAPPPPPPPGPGVIPEPSSVLLLGLGVIGALGYGLRRKLAK